MPTPRFARNGLISLLGIAFAGLALAQIGGVLGSSPEPSALSRILPARIEVLTDSGKSLGGASRKEGDPWRLFDGDTESGFVGSGEGAVRLRLALDGPHTLAAVGAFGPADGRLTVWAEQEGVPVALFDLEPRAAGWSRAEVAQPFATRALLLDWQPASPGAALPEIELWSSGVAAEDKPDSPRLAMGSPAALRITESATGDGAFRVRLPVDPAAVSRVFLSYELTGLSHWSSAVRSINGLPAQGWGATPAAEPSAQSEEIDPAWLHQGINEIRFAPAHEEPMPEAMTGERGKILADTAAEGVSYEVRNIRLVVVGEPGRTEAGTWNGASPLALAPARPAQPFGLEVTAGSGVRGMLTAVARLAGGGVVPLCEPVDLGALGAGCSRSETEHRGHRITVVRL